MGMLNKIFGRNEKIKVQFYDSTSQKLIGVAEMLPGQLPETFAIETKMTLQNSEWLVEEAVPITSAEFTKSKSLILKMSKIELLGTSDILYTLPSISNDFPITADTALYQNHTFDIFITEDEWRQNEFLNSSLLQLVETEIEKITEIIENHSKAIDDQMTAFGKCHLRTMIENPDLEITLPRLKELLSIVNIGNVKMIGSGKFLQNGLCLATDNTTFYGVLKSGNITHLGISEFSEKSFNEIKAITRAFDLIFVDWYNCDIIS